MIEIERKISQFTSCGNLDIKCCENCVNYVSGLCILNMSQWWTNILTLIVMSGSWSRRKTIKKEEEDYRRSVLQ